MEEVCSRRWAILAAVLVGGIMAPLDGSIVNVTLPTIALDFGASMAVAEWVPVIYLLILSGIMLTFGRLGDMWGYRRLFLSGLVFFVIASALCGLSRSISMLIMSRGFQSLGACMFTSVLPAIIAATFPPSERGRALGLNGMTVALGLALGPSLGGMISSWLGWRWVFFINLPIGMVSLILCWRLLPPDRPVEKQYFDPWGAVLAFIFLFSLVFLLNRGAAIGWFSLSVLGLVSVCVSSLVAFVRLELVHPYPMLDLTLFRQPVFSFNNAAALFNFMAQYTIVFLTPFYLRQYLNLGPHAVGLIMTCFPVIVLVVAPLAGALSDRVGTYGLALLGSGICAVALLGLTLFSSLSIAWVCLFLGLFGLGTGLFQSPNNSAVMGSVPKHRLGIASGVLATVRNVGMASGIAVAAAVFTSREAEYILRDMQPAFVYALRDAYTVGTLCALAGAVCCVVAGRRGKLPLWRRRHASEGVS